MTTNNVKVNDRWIFIYVYPILAIAILHIGNDNTFLELLKIPSYYTDIILSLSVIYIVGFYIRRVQQQLENKLDWDKQLNTRINFQLLLGLLIPAVFAVTVEILYLKIINIPIANSSIFYLELPVITIFLLIINLIYFILYYRLHAMAIHSDLQSLVIKKNETPPEFIIAKQGNQMVQIPLDAIAYFFSKDKLTFLVTEENRHLLYDKTMKEVVEILPQDYFYRLNRQLIVKNSSIKKFSRTDTRRLKIELSPPLNEDIFMAKAKIPTFITWLNTN